MLLVVVNTINDATDIVSSTEPQMMCPEAYDVLVECIEQSNAEMDGLLTFEAVVLQN